MTRPIDCTMDTDSFNIRGLFATGPLDARSIVCAIAGAAGFYLLAIGSLALSRFDSSLAAVWLPNACAVAFLLRARLGNELPFYAATLAASVLGNASTGTPVDVALIFSIANLLDISMVTWLTRSACGDRPDMSRVDHLARFVWAGGMVGPILSASFASIAMGPGDESIWNGAINWFLTDSMGMILIVPAILLVADAIQRGETTRTASIVESALMLAVGSICVALVFRQTQYPLLFLVPPITLFFAFRLGSLGTAFFVALVAAITSAMTWIGYGPIVERTASEIARLHVIQAFIAANFLTGLPVSAILAGRAKIVQELEDGRRELALLTENTTDALMRFDLTGLCTYASPSVETVLGEPVETFLGNRPTDRMHEDARERITLAQRRLIAGESEKERFTYRRFHDSEEGLPIFIEAECAIAYSSETGQREGIVVSARDVTDRVELELLLTRARRRAEKAANAKSEFLANMSHEIRTPMNGVLGFAEMLLQDDIGQQQRRHTEMIVESGRSMMLLLNDILDLSKIEAGQITIDQAPIDLAATIEECAALHRPTAEKKGLSVVVDHESGPTAVSPGEEQEPPWVITDGLRLRQMVLNLVGNAVKFTEHGHVRVSYEVEDHQFRVKVSDTGIGIGPAQIEAIFRPFTQAESNTTRRFGGTGLGLSISKQLAELLGGYIEVESQPGVGSCFSLTLPTSLTSPEVLPEPAETARSTRFEPNELPQAAKVLLAEDHDVNRELVVEMLERCGQNVMVAHDGNEAITMVMDGMMRGDPFDLVLMDVQMPGCDGYSATQAIREEGISAHELPIIALTANAFPEDIVAARKAGMQAHLAKPLDFAALARALQRWLPVKIVDDEAGFRRGRGEGDTDATTDAPVPQIAGFTRQDDTSPGHSPTLIRRWNERRREAVDAVYQAQNANRFADGSLNEEERDTIARLLHKLAGTAAIFGEAELGDQAGAFERALKKGLSNEVCEAHAKQLLELAGERSEEVEAANEASG